MRHKYRFVLARSWVVFLLAAVSGCPAAAGGNADRDGGSDRLRDGGGDSGLAGDGGTGDAGGTNAAVAVSAGTYHSCAVTRIGSVKCWGGNRFGQLGDGTTTDRSTPVEVVGLGSGVSSVVAAFGYSCALLSSGGVKCWGNNGSGSLGDGTTVDRHTPVDVYGLGSGVAAIAAGGGHACALTKSGGLMCWGRNNNGQVGDGSQTDRWWPRSAQLAEILVSVAAGYNHTCALTSRGGLKCWGFNGDGELGIGSTNGPYLSPQDVTGLLAGVTAIAAGFNHTCAFTVSGLKCWGYNRQGQLGDGTLINRLTPVQVTGLSTPPSWLAAGTDRTCVVLGGGIKCWGFNSSGAVGDGTTVDRSFPTNVVGLSSEMMNVATGENHSCATTADGHIKCWGSNAAGKLGDGTTMDRLTPVDVMGF